MNEGIDRRQLRLAYAPWPFPGSLFGAMFELAIVLADSAHGMDRETNVDVIYPVRLERGEKVAAIKFAGRHLKLYQKKKMRMCERCG